MGAKKNFLRNLFNNEQRTFHERLFVFQQIIIPLSMLILLGVNVIIGNGSVQSLTAMGVVAVIGMVFGVLVFRFGKVQFFAAVWIAMVLTGMAFTGFVSENGFHDGILLWFMLCTLSIRQLITGWKKWFLLLWEAVCIVLYYSSSIAHDLMAMADFSLRIRPYIDSIAALFLLCTAVYLLVSFEMNFLRQSLLRAEEARRQSERLNRAQNRFFSSMSHDLRSPVNEIINLNEMILRDKKISPDVQEDSYNIRSSAKMLLNVINDVLDISKIEAGKLEIKPTEYDVGTMFSDLVGIFWTQARDKGLEFRIDISPEMPARLYGDEMRIRQCLINIINNAIKYTVEGSVTLSVQPRYDGNKLTVIYSVADTGTGIRKESLAYIFNAFRREDEESARNIVGTGLGLSIVKRLAELMGGSITVNSIYQKGSTFVLTVPQKRVGSEFVIAKNIGQRIATSRNYIPRFEAKDAHMLVVDDNRTNLVIVQKLLKETGVHIDTAQSGAETLKKTLETAYDLILLEHNMAGMNGIECLRRIRDQSNGRSNKAKIIALTANEDSGNAAFYSSAGFDGYLMKPFDSRTLELECARLLPADLVTFKQDDEEDGTNADSIHVREYVAKERVRITTESSSDLPKELLQQYHIGVIPWCVATPNGIFRDGVEIGPESLLVYMDNKDDKKDHSVSTLPPDKESYENFFSDSLQRADNVIHVRISGNLVGSGAPNANEAAGSFENVSVIDSWAVSGGQGLLTLEAADCARKGNTPEEIIAHLESMRKLLHGSFVTESLDILCMNRQINPVFHHIFDSLTGCPVLYIRRGKVRLRTVFFGRHWLAWRKYIRMELRAWKNIDHRRLMVTYAGLSPEDLEFIRQELEKRYPFEDIIFHKMSPSITANCGKHTFGLFFFRNAPKTVQMEY